MEKAFVKSLSKGLILVLILPVWLTGCNNGNEVNTGILNNGPFTVEQMRSREVNEAYNGNWERDVYCLYAFSISEDGESVSLQLSDFSFGHDTDCVFSGKITDTNDTAYGYDALQQGQLLQIDYEFVQESYPSHLVNASKVQIVGFASPGYMYKRDMLYLEEHEAVDITLYYPVENSERFGEKKTQTDDILVLLNEWLLSIWPEKSNEPNIYYRWGNLGFDTNGEELGKFCHVLGDTLTLTSAVYQVEDTSQSVTSRAEKLTRIELTPEQLESLRLTLEGWPKFSVFDEIVIVDTYAE